MARDPKMRLCMFWFPPGQWRMPDAISGVESDFKIFAHITQMAEQAKMDAIFFADSVTSQPVDLIAKRASYGEQIPRGAGLEPMTTLAALATVTSRIGLIATATTTYNEPYHIARRFATIDQISGGRGGWNLVTSQTESEAQNFGFDSHMEHDRRYERASEFYDVVAGLWDSWEDGAMLEEKDTARYFDMSKAHLLNHVGSFFKVRGPLNVLRSPQGRPVVVQAGASGPGKALAARIADCVFSAQSKLDEGKAFHDEIKGLAAGHGRRPQDIKIMPGLAPIIASTQAEAEELQAQFQSLITDEQALRSLYRISGGLDLTKFPLDGPMPELPISNGAQARQKILVDMARKENLTLRQAARRFAQRQAHHHICGTVSTVADVMQEWFEKEACDGFCMMPSYYPRGVADITEKLVPELQRRGLFRKEYESSILRENLGLPIPENRYA
jgi:N-acetyl-S-(2-succino)cysteine monooxygenase